MKTAAASTLRLVAAPQVEYRDLTVFGVAIEAAAVEFLAAEAAATDCAHVRVCVLVR